MDEAEIIAEGEALTTALGVIEGHHCPVEARSVVATYRRKFTNRGDAESYAIDTATQKICGQPLDNFPQFVPSTRGTEEDTLFEGLSYLWICWACQRNVEEGLDRLTHLEIVTGKNSLLNLMALHHWKGAIFALIEEDLVEARRLYRRATQLGSEYGTPSNPTIQWTYAASFFDHSC